MKRKQILQEILTIFLFGFFAYLAAAVALGTLVIYNKLVGQ